MRGDLNSHRYGTLGGAVGGEPIDLVGQDAQRRLQAMRQITGLDAATGDDLLVALKQRVEIVDQRLGLGWERALEPFDPPLADRRHTVAEPVERSESDPDLDRGGREQGKRQDAKRQDERARECRDRRGQLRFVRGGDHPVGPWSIRQRHGPFQGDQALPLLGSGGGGPRRRGMHRPAGGARRPKATATGIAVLREHRPASRTPNTACGIAGRSAHPSG